MVEIRTPIAVHEAVDQIVKHISEQRKIESVALSDAFGRYLAKDLIADHPVPLFDRTPLDGFAICAEDTENAHHHTVELKVIESIGAGYVAGQEVKSGQAIRIMTGAPIPAGANAIVMFELVEEIEKDGQAYIRVNSRFKPGDNIIKKGEDTQEGTVLAKAGRRIGVGEMAMLSTFGCAHVDVYCAPVVAIYATGTELVSVDTPLAPGKIRNSNSYMLESQLRQVGAIPKNNGILSDDYELCFQSVKDALHEGDYVITTGGVSVGDYDFIPDILKQLGAHVLFNKVAMRPGSVTTVAKLGDKWIFGLSGNPSACFVGFELFMRPVLKEALGAQEIHIPRAQAILEHDITTKNVFTRFMRAKMEVRAETCYVSSIGLDKSGVVSSLVEANVLMVIPPDVTLRSNDLVEVIWLDQFNKDYIYV